MVFGNEASIPLNLMTEINVTEEEPSTNESAYVRKLELELATTGEIVRELTGKTSQRQKRYYDRKVREINYDIGELVRRNQPKIITGTKAKLARSWTGPWTIVQRLSDVLYQIRHSTSSKLVVVHADNLKPFKTNVPGAADDNLYRDDDDDGWRDKQEVTTRRYRWI